MVAGTWLTTGAFFAGCEFQTVKLLGFVFAQAAGKSMVVDQILVDGRVVAFEAQLGFDECPVGLADGSR